MITINSFLTAYLIVYLISSIIEITIDLINVIHLRRYGSIVPEGFEELIDEQKIKEIINYTIINYLTFCAINTSTRAF